MATWHNPIYNRNSSDEYYNISDLNRVEENTQYLADRLNVLGYYTSLTTKYDWLRTNFFDTTNGARYLGNIQALMDWLTFGSSTPSLPASMENLTYSNANDIEKIQLDIYDSIGGMEYEINLKRAGTFYAGIGEPGLI